MQKECAFILGGTKGLGRELAWESHRRGVSPIVAGRSVRFNSVTKALPPSATFCDIDLTDSRTFPNIIRLSGLSVPYFFWNAGVWLNKSFLEVTAEEQEAMIKTHLTGPWDVLFRFIGSKREPFHLVVVASTSSWRLRYNESCYCALKAAKTAFARNFARELARDFPGSKTLLVCPAGMDTGFFGDGRDTSMYLDTKKVAKIVWDEVAVQSESFVWLNIERTGKGEPIVSYGPKLPELP